jgi:hypothetical protein
MGTWVLVLMLYSGTGTAMTNVFGFASEAACKQEGQRWENRGRTTHQYHCLEVKGNGEG